MEDNSNDGAGFQDAWMSARIGNAIDALVDRSLNRPQMGSDPAQAYGVDQNGRIYTLGQVNGQVAAQVTTAPASNKMLPWFVIAAIVYFAVEAK